MTEADNNDVKFFERLVDSGLSELDRAEKLLWSNDKIRTYLRQAVIEYISKLQQLRAVRNKIVNKSNHLTKNNQSNQTQS